MENMEEEEGKNTYLLGGGEKREWTPAEAADWFAEQYLPDLRQVSVRFPEKWLYSGCSIQTPDLPHDQLEKQMYENVELGEKGKVGSFMGNVRGDIAEYDELYKHLQEIRGDIAEYDELYKHLQEITGTSKQMYETVELGEKGKVGSFMGNVTGDNAEHEMYKYLTRIPKTSRTALFVNYNVSMFQRFTGQPHQDQEFDIVLVFGELRKWLTIEVKPGQTGGAGWIGQLVKGKIFYNEVLATTGIETKDWEYIPVAAFPNAQNRNQVLIITLKNLNV